MPVRKQFFIGIFFVKKILNLTNKGYNSIIFLYKNIEKGKNMDNFFYKVRKDLHEMPEIALQEYNTSKYIRDFLKNLDIKYVEIERSTLAIFEGRKIIG